MLLGLKKTVALCAMPTLGAKYAPKTLPQAPMGHPSLRRVER
jgi:hypothetical protein